ncbi:UNVERIFIED_CONTAM: hypothetical protein RKD50_009594 [Streptomyces canus]
MIAFFTGYGTFDLTVLGVVGLMTLFVGSVFARTSRPSGSGPSMASRRRTPRLWCFSCSRSASVSAMIKASGISNGFVWLATELNLSGGAYVAVAFLVVCVIAMAAGSSIGTMFTVFPILYPAGVAVGAQAGTDGRRTYRGSGTLNLQRCDDHANPP